MKKSEILDFNWDLVRGILRHEIMEKTIFDDGHKDIADLQRIVDWINSLSTIEKSDGVDPI